jgi:hypothetical protein
MNKTYIISVLAMILVIPSGGFLTEHALCNTPLSFDFFAKWFIFSAVGLRLFFAGIQQSARPAFTAKEIFHIEHAEPCFPIVRELGFANICFGLMGIVSLFRSEWRVVSAFVCGLYFAFAALLHISRKSVGTNENFALFTNILIVCMLVLYLVL